MSAIQNSYNKKGGGTSKKKPLPFNKPHLTDKWKKALLQHEYYG